MSFVDGGRRRSERRGAGGGAAGGGSDLPLTVSGDSRWLQRPSGAKFNLNGDTVWSLPVNMSAADVPTYLADRAAKGVNAIIVNLIEHKFSEQTPAYRNKAGDDPFTALVSGVPDFTTPNAAYWNFVDSIINQANALGIVVFAFPCYMGFGQGVEGWANEINLNGAARMTTYGTFLGNRYKNFPNVIWSMGGDSGPTGPVGDLTVHVNNLANAIKAADANHLMTAHGGPGTISTDAYNQAWLDFVVAYPSANTDLNLRVRTAYNHAPTKPSFMVEGNYGNEHAMTDILLRTEMYQSVLGGGFGHFYGQSPMWYFGVNAGASGNAFADIGGLDWHAQLNTFGSNFLTFVKRLQAARPLSTLTPDYTHVVVTAGFGVDGITYVPVLATNRILLAYTKGVSLTVAKTAFIAATFNINWYNVRDGSTTNGGTVVMGAGSQVFNPPDANDWVLMLDDQALALTNP